MGLAAAQKWIILSLSSANCLSCACSLTMSRSAAEVQEASAKTIEDWAAPVVGFKLAMVMKTIANLSWLKLAIRNSLDLA